ncbi:DUF1080 domain-containing protein [Candidatus Poribacteria bacterium]|nr:DUF1080 domain-containing protein [Candidatus Poribacteria bacterium]
MNSLTAAEQRDGWRLLFDGKSLDGWDATGSLEGWTVDGDAIACTVNRGGYLYTQDTFEDFELRISFRIASQCNSGIFFRWSDLSDPVNTGYEIQVLDTFGPDRTGVHDCGAIYELVPPSKQTMKPAGEWNDVVLKCEGPHISVSMNGEEICTMNSDLWDTPHQNPDGTKTKFNYAWKDLPRRGHIGLQDHGGKVWYRDVKVREL